MSNHDELPTFAVSGHASSTGKIVMPLQKRSTDIEIASDGSAGSKDATQWAKSVTKEVKLKARKLLRIDETKQQLRDDQGGVSRKIQDDPGFNPSETLNAESSTFSHLKDQLPGNFHDLAHIIRHPQHATQGKAERTLATSEEPYLSQSDDEQFLRAHRNLEEPTPALPDEDSDDDPDDGQRRNLLKKTFDDLQESREAKRVAWTLTRYVHRARVVTPEYYKFPVLSLFRWVDHNDEPQGYQWSQWFHHIRLLFRQAWVDSSSSEPPEDSTWHRDLLLQQAERIVMASSPLQKRLSRLRRLWQWENPRKSGAWFAIWMIVWYNNRVFTFIYCIMAYTIARRQLEPERMRLLQESYDRVSDEDATPNTFGEMISRHGSSDWLEPMLEHVGPIIQPQFKDLADWMEVFINFYEWKTPRATAAILFVIGCAIAMATFLTTELNSRILTLIAIFGFFTDRPITSRFPNYHRVIAPMHWIFWDIPTHIETSFKYLQKQAEDMRNAALEADRSSPDEVPASKTEQAVNGQASSLLPTSIKDKLPKPSDTNSSDIFATSCTWNTITGHIIITFTTIRFTRHFPKKELWNRPFTSLLEIKKGNGQTSIIKKTQNFLELTFKDGSVETLEQLKKKDEVFNVAVAFSGLTWQQIDP
jgi:hypothetical protein